MMASRKSGAGVSRPRRMSSKRGGMVQFALIGAGVVVVVVVALLLFGGRGKKPPAQARPKKADAGEGAVAKKTHTPARSGSVARAPRAGRDEERAKRREERLQQKQEVRGGRTGRSSSGGYSRGNASSGSSADPSQLRAILTDGAGSRFALVGERRFKSGDDIEGRRILEVSGDGIKMEYRQNTYTVKVGQKVY